MDRAKLIPWSQEKSDNPVVTIYVVTGRHGILKIPESFCKECNMFFHAAEEASQDLDFDVDIRVRSWWTSFLIPLIKGGYHAPIMMVDGSVLAQGYDVPSPDMVKKALETSRSL